MERVYYIGGSPCCGKSTIGRRIAEQYGGIHFEADEFLEACVKRGLEDGKPYATKQALVYGSMKWQRDPKQQAEEELLLYEELLPYMMDFLEKSKRNGIIIAEGAVFLPRLMKEMIKAEDKYLCMIPEPQFQIQKYKERSWVQAVVETCDNPQLAFEHWMERDILFAKEVGKQAKDQGYPVIYVDGSRNLNEIAQEVYNTLEL